MRHDPSRRAFADLRRALLRGRWRQIEPLLRVELGALALLLNGFLFWQVRIALASLAHDRGRAATASLLGVTLLLIAVGGAALGWGRLRSLLANPGALLPWLGLPIPYAAIGQQLRWEARYVGRIAAWFAPGPLVAAVGIVPPLDLVLIAFGFAVTLEGATWTAGQLGLALAGRRAEHRPGIDPIAVALSTPPRTPRTVARRAPGWRRLPRWRALLAKDALLARNPGPARLRLLSAVLVFALSVLAWSIPAMLPIARWAAFTLALVAAVLFAEAILDLAEADPFPVLRGLPVGPGALWASRAIAVLGFAVAVVAAHAWAGRALERAALEVFLVWIGLATFALGTLATHYAITLFPRIDVARRLFQMALGLSMAASLMIPLLGWIVLLTGVLHSARRLPRWAWLEN